MPRHTRLDTLAASTLVALCLLWGVQQVVIKLTAPDVSPLLQAGLRSAIAAACVLVWLGVKRIPLFDRDGTLKAGVFVGALFGLEFALIYQGLQYTTASRAVILLYSAPFWVALGAHFLIPGEHVRRVQLIGLIAAFSGILIAFGDALRLPNARELLGDVMLLGAGFVWAATTVAIKASSLAHIHPGKTLLYQLAVSALLLPLASLAMGEPGIVRLSAFAIGSLAFQGVIVAFISYLIWFWLMTQYPASRLSAFSFLSPLFGVGMGAFWLDERITWPLLAALALVGAGIYLVNKPRD